MGVSPSKRRENTMDYSYRGARSTSLPSVPTHTKFSSSTHSSSQQQFHQPPNHQHLKLLQITQQQQQLQLSKQDQERNQNALNILSSRKSLPQYSSSITLSQHQSNQKQKHPSSSQSPLTALPLALNSNNDLKQQQPLLSLETQRNNQPNILFTLTPPRQSLSKPTSESYQSCSSSNNKNTTACFAPAAAAAAPVVQTITQIIPMSQQFILQPNNNSSNNNIQSQQQIPVCITLRECIPPIAKSLSLIGKQPQSQQYLTKSQSNYQSMPSSSILLNQRNNQNSISSSSSSSSGIKLKITQSSSSSPFASATKQQSQITQQQSSSSRKTIHTTTPPEAKKHYSNSSQLLRKSTNIISAQNPNNILHSIDLPVSHLRNSTNINTLHHSVQNPLPPAQHLLQFSYNNQFIPRSNSQPGIEKSLISSGTNYNEFPQAGTAIKVQHASQQPPTSLSGSSKKHKPSNVTPINQNVSEDTKRGTQNSQQFLQRHSSRESIDVFNPYSGAGGLDYFEKSIRESSRLVSDGNLSSARIQAKQLQSTNVAMSQLNHLDQNISQQSSANLAPASIISATTAATNRLLSQYVSSQPIIPTTNKGLISYSKMELAKQNYSQPVKIISQEEVQQQQQKQIFGDVLQQQYCSFGGKETQTQQQQQQQNQQPPQNQLTTMEFQLTEDHEESIPQCKGVYVNLANEMRLQQSQQKNEQARQSFQNKSNSMYSSEQSSHSRQQSQLYLQPSSQINPDLKKSIEFGRLKQYQTLDECGQDEDDERVGRPIQQLQNMFDLEDQSEPPKEIFKEMSLNHQYLSIDKDGRQQQLQQQQQLCSNLNHPNSNNNSSLGSQSRSMHESSGELKVRTYRKASELSRRMSESRFKSEEYAEQAMGGIDLGKRTVFQKGYLSKEVQAMMMIDSASRSSQQRSFRDDKCVNSSMSSEVNRAKKGGNNSQKNKRNNNDEEVYRFEDGEDIYFESQPRSHLYTSVLSKYSKYLDQQARDENRKRDLQFASKKSGNIQSSGISAKRNFQF